jgi:hypothetical protein
MPLSELLAQWMGRPKTWKVPTMIPIPINTTGENLKED